MKTTILLLVSVTGLSAQSLAVTSPADGSVVTWGFPLTAVPTLLPSMTQVKFYVDGRLECVVNTKYLGGWSCPKLYYATYSDERAATIYAKAYNAVGTLLATSPTNTFRINNTGVNAVQTFNFGGIVTNGATVSGTGTFLNGMNATVSGAVGGTNVDGIGGTASRITALNANVNLTTGAFTVPVITLPNNSRVELHCTPATPGNPCVGGDADLPAGLPGNPYLKICGPNCVQLSATQGGAAVVPTTRGVTTEYTTISAFAAEWVVSGNTGQQGSTVTLDTTYFLDGKHRFSQMAQSPGGSFGLTGTFTFLSSAITTSTGIVAVTNFPLVQGQAITVASSGSLPAQWTGTMYAVVLDANDFCLASSPANAAAHNCISSLSSAGSGTDTVSFIVPSTFLDTTSGQQQLYGTDVNEFTFSNGAVPCVLRTKYSKISGIAGDAFDLAPYILNCDKSTTSISNSLPVYSSSDSTRVTVSSAGHVVLGSTTGHALISVTDNTHLRGTIVDVEVRPDRITYDHLSKGCGIIHNYDPACSVVAIAPFNGNFDMLTHTPFPIKYLKPAFTAMLGGYSSVTIAADAGSNYGTYAAWLSAHWNDGYVGDSYSKAFVLDDFSKGGGMLFWSTGDQLCGEDLGFNLYSLYHDTWRQQALSTMFNDLYPMTLEHEHCDETNAKLGAMMRPRGDMGSGQDGLGRSTVSGHTAGLTSIVVTGCAATPCQGTGTVNIVSWPGWLAGGYIAITGASVANLNGPHVTSNGLYNYDNPIGAYLTSFQIVTYDVPNGTYNFSTDPNLVVLIQGYNYDTIFASQTGAPPSWGSTLTSLVCASNICTVNWTGHPFTNGQVVRLAGFTTPGFPSGQAFYRADVVNANSFTVRLASVANGTYNSITDPGATVDPRATFPQTLVQSFFKDYFTGHKAPIAASQQGGYSGGLAQYSAWQGPNSVTDFVVQNASPSGPFDRYGQTAMAYRNEFRQGQLDPLTDGSLPINVVSVTKPVIFESQLSGMTCTHFVATSDCRTEQIPGDLISFEPMFGGGAFISNIIPWIMPNGVGSKPYQYESDIGLGRVPSPATSVGSQYWQSAPNEVDLYPDQWLALVSANLAVQHEDKYLLQPPLSSPDENVGPGPWPYTQIECQSHTSSYGNAMLCVNLSEEEQTVILDYSIINPGGTGGPMRRWNLSAFGDTVTSLSPSTTSETLTLLYGQAILVISQTAGSRDDLQTINVTLTPRYGATNAVLEIHYYPTDQVFQSVDCGTGACPPIKVNLHNLDVYVRKRFTKSDGTVVATGDLERLAAK